MYNAEVKVKLTPISLVGCRSPIVQVSSGRFLFVLMSFLFQRLYHLLFLISQSMRHTASWLFDRSSISCVDSMFHQVSQPEIILIARKTVLKSNQLI